VNGIAPPLDLDDFRRRSHAIWVARVEAREKFEAHGLAEADAEHHFRVEKAKRLAALRAGGKTSAEALALADGDSVVAEHRRTRDKEATLKRAAAMHIEELERNAANLRKEADMSGGIE
jgi:hypothetical protein